MELQLDIFIRMQCAVFSSFRFNREIDTFWLITDIANVPGKGTICFIIRYILSARQCHNFKVSCIDDVLHDSICTCINGRLNGFTDLG